MCRQYKASLLTKKVGLSMKVNKSQATMLILKMLLENDYIIKDEVMSLLDINDLSFFRYIQEIKAFFYNFDTGLEIEYSRSENRYILLKR